MDKKIIVKIILIVILLILIFNIDYCIYMFIKNDIATLPNSVNYIEYDMFDIAKSYTNDFFSKLENGEYEEAFNMLHENCKRDLFDSDLGRFTKVIEGKYFNKQVGNKYYSIEEGVFENVNTENSFHAYYKVSVFCESSALENTEDYYKARIINVDVIKNDGKLKLTLVFEENNEENNKD